jgi:hypothetical protein
LPRDQNRRRNEEDRELQQLRAEMKHLNNLRQDNILPIYGFSYARMFYLNVNYPKFIDNEIVFQPMGPSVSCTSICRWVHWTNG